MDNCCMTPLIIRIVELIQAEKCNSPLPAPLIQGAIEEGPSNSNILFDIAIDCAQNNKFDRAIEILTQLSVTLKGEPEIFYSLGFIYSSKGDHHKALIFYDKTLQIESSHNFALVNKGATLNSLLRHEEALIFLDKAIKVNPNLAEAWSNKGTSLDGLMRYEEALAHYDKAISLRHDYADAYYNRGNALKELAKFTESRTSYQQALNYESNHFSARWGLALSHIPSILDCNDDVDSIRENFLLSLQDLDTWLIDDRLDDAYTGVGSSQPFYLAYQERNNKSLISRYGDICHKAMHRFQSNLKNIEIHAYKQLRKKIRIGIVSDHIRNHSVWNAITKGIVHNVNLEKFEIHIFYLGSTQDSETEEAKLVASSFTQNKTSLLDWVQSIKNKEVDALIYPEIGMHALTCQLANLRLAPTQAVLWGHPETTGLPTIDYFISAESFESELAQDNYREKLVKLPNLGCFYGGKKINPMAFDLAQFNLNSNAPLLICPGTPFKYAPEFDWIIVEIAKQVADCQFVFFESDGKRHVSLLLEKRLLKAFKESNLDGAKYIKFIPWQTSENFYSLMKKADVFIDTIGFSGFNTALQAIECDLPIVTREGLFMRGRLASGILKRMQLPELVAGNADEYISLVVKLALDKEYSTSIKKRIINNKAILFDDLEPIRALEDFLSENIELA